MKLGWWNEPKARPADAPADAAPRMVEVTLLASDTLYERAKKIMDGYPYRVVGCGYHEAGIAHAMRCLEIYKLLDTGTVATHPKEDAETQGAPSE